MKRIVEYQMPEDQFNDLIKDINAGGEFSAHGYRGMGFGTIDDGTSKDWGYCQRFSKFQKSEDKRSIILRVKDPRLVEIVDNYFTEKSLI